MLASLALMREWARYAIRRKISHVGEAVVAGYQVSQEPLSSPFVKPSKLIWPIVSQLAIPLMQNQALWCIIGHYFHPQTTVNAI